MVKRRSSRVAKGTTPANSSPTKRQFAPDPSSLWRSICSDYLPNLLVVAVAFAAVWFEFTTHDVYRQHVELQILLKRSFIVWVCLCARTQLTDFVTPPELGRRPPSIRRAITRHARALFAAIAANSLGTTIIRPIFGAAPQYEETIRLVVPIYFLVVVVVDVLRIPMPVLKAIVGLSVSWLKAFTIPKLVMEWQSIENAHPFAFVALSTANLYASGVVLRYLANYGRSHRLVDLSAGTIAFVLQIVGTSAAIGLVAHIANHFLQSPDKALEARVLYFCVAWFALNKYWKKALGDLLVVLFVPHNNIKKIKTS
ncbi:hypothetical protein PHYBOEH_004230 [Phytophthora boehmeriae]|uniref:Transmembrane protein n=1 Tax=Phytophthora boehmeriae TaxID=109152 RepID=A0A8T1WRX9_9STRA|nr:hypothetical protein PHYBOEH_004230 [Phytophthora boehmeriae]